MLDRLYFQTWTFPPYYWLHFNLAQSLAVFYGRNDWHYYLSQGISLSCTTLTPFVLWGLWKAGSSSHPWPTGTANALRTLAFAVITTISTLSLISHKEVRFIYPLVPIMHILGAPHVLAFFTQTSTDSAGAAARPKRIVRRWPRLAVALLTNVVIGVYLASFHAAAPIQVMTFLRSEFERIHPQHLAVRLPAEAAPSEPLELFAVFLTQCHTTPWRSHLVYPALRARALTCEPPLDTRPATPERAAYQDESSRFFADQLGFLSRALWPPSLDGEQMPRYIVGFEGIEDSLETFFGPAGAGADYGVALRKAWTGWNGLFTDDPDRKSGRLVVWDTGLYADRGGRETEG